MRTIRRLIVAGAVLCVLGAPPVAAQATTVLATRIEGPITPVIATHMSKAVQRASDQGHAALLVEMDTPGGLDTSMRDIIQSFLNSEVPVIVWVSPSGARAASAGAMIGLSAHVLAMAPGTAIGAATPVDMQGGEIGDKVINDAAAYSVAVARERGRDETFAREAVTKGRSEPATEAVEIGVADFLASTRSEVLDTATDRTVTVSGGRELTLALKGASEVEHEMSWFSNVRQRLADPNIAFLFLSLGGLAIIYELANPGVGLGGVAGVIMLLLAFFALSVLPVSVVGILLLLLAAGLLTAEVFVPGVGVFAAGGAVSLVLAGLFLFEGSMSVDLSVLLPLAIVVAGAAILAGRLVVGTFHNRPTIGGSEMVDQVARVQNGQVFLSGTWWRVRGHFPEGAEVRVTAVEGLDLLVEPVAEKQEG